MKGRLTVSTSLSRFTLSSPASTREQPSGLECARRSPATSTSKSQRLNDKPIQTGPCGGSNRSVPSAGSQARPSDPAEQTKTPRRPRSAAIVRSSSPSPSGRKAKRMTTRCQSSDTSLEASGSGKRKRAQEMYASSEGDTPSRRRRVLDRRSSQADTSSDDDSPILRRRAPRHPPPAPNRRTSGAAARCTTPTDFSSPFREATPGAEMPGPADSTRPVVNLDSGQTSCEEMFQHLVNHGCANLSSHMNPDQYSSGLIIGGAFGDIWKGKLRDGTEVAIKVWRFSSLLHSSSKSMKRAMREIYYWSKAKHENVQELMGVVMFQGRLGMVSQWMDNGNLREYIYKNPHVDRYPLCVQVATGLEYLHSQQMVHGDLKGANILVSCDGIVKLSDFDHSIMSECSLAFSETSKTGGGTTRWMAPELILENGCNRSAYTDVYALGMTMLEIITGNSPYYLQCKDDVNVIMAIMKKTLPERSMDSFGDNMRDNQMWDLLLSCWSFDPVERPKAAEVLQSLHVIATLSNNNVTL